jgi:hypothetical protein
LLSGLHRRNTFFLGIVITCKFFQGRNGAAEVEGSS